MKTSLMTLLVSLLMIGCSSTPKKNESANKAGEFVNSFIQKHNIPGASVAFLKDGEIIHTANYGFADIENKTAPTDTTLWRIASASKPITAIAMFKVLEDSGANLEQALNKPVFGPRGYLPKYRHIRDKRVYKITLRDLLQHSGGWDSSVSGDPQYEVYTIAKKMKAPVPASAETVIAYVLKYQKLDVDPGKEFHYSNLGFNILARIIESLSNMPYEQYVQQKILQPLGITDMKIAGNTLQDRLPNEARYYDDPRSAPNKSVFDNKTMGPQSYNGYVFHTMDGHGGWLATPSDLVKIANAVTPWNKGVQILKPETVAVMTAPVTTIGNPTACLGWVCMDGGKNIGHAGALETGTLSYFTRHGDGYSWAVVFNRLPVKNLEEIGLLGKELLDGVNGKLK